MPYLPNYGSILPINFSLNLLFKKKDRTVIVLSIENIEYKGYSNAIDKNFNFVLGKSVRLNTNTFCPQLDKFEIIFIRGENVVNFSFISI